MPDTTSDWEPGFSGTGRHGADSGEHPGTIAQYEIISTIGTGGMGTIYLAYDPLMHRIVAVKVLKNVPALQDEYTVSARFLAEAMLTGRLTHAGIIPIYQVGIDKRRGYYYSMRYLQGRTLQHILRERARDSRAGEEGFLLPRLLDVFSRVCDAMAHAHRNGILHRDLKPANVMITDSNEVLVVDWGLAKDLRSHDPLDMLAAAGAGEDVVARLRSTHYQTTGAFLSQSSAGTAQPEQMARYQRIIDHDGDHDEALYNLTQAGQLVGTPWYMSPEQIRGDAVAGTASDVYSLGVILYRMLTNTLPVESKNITELIARVRAGDIRRVETQPAAARLPRALCTIVNKALAFKSHERYQDAGQLGEDIRLYLEGRTPLAPLVITSFKDPENRDATLRAHWVIEGALHGLQTGMEAPQGVRLSSTQRARGDFCASLSFRAHTAAWAISIAVGIPRDDGEISAYYELRIGVEERPFVELFWRGRRVQRRFDLRLQEGQTYQAGVELENGLLRLRIDDDMVLSYREVFPVTGGMLTITIRAGSIVLEDFGWLSRGAPLNLSYQFFPDRYFLSGRYGDALHLYLQLAESHPDREEGLLALYKAGLCAAELKDGKRAVELFSRLEHTMLDQYSTLGLARIGLLDGNLDWAWDTLKQGYLQHSAADGRTDIWFALLDVLEQYGNDQSGGKLPRYLEMLRDLQPSPQEATQITFEYLDLAGRLGGMEALRREALKLTQTHAGNLPVVAEALYALWRTGLDETVGTLVLGVLKRFDLGAPGDSESAVTRLLLMSAELELAQDKLDSAVETLRQASQTAIHSRNERLWALNWTILCGYLKGDFEKTLARARDTLQYMDQYSSNQLSYLLFLVSLLLLRQGKASRAHEALDRARRCPGWWGRVAATILDQRSTSELACAQSNANLSTEALYLAGELHLRLGNGELAKEHFKLCDMHPSRRLMTRQLARARLREMLRQSEAPQQPL